MPAAGGVKPAAPPETGRGQTSVKGAWELVIDVDDVMKVQGCDPALIRARRSPVLQVAERALELSAALLHPAVAWRSVPVVGLRHGSLLLEGSYRLTGSIVVENLAAAKQVVAVVCTLGPELEDRASASFSEDPALAVALDAVGSAALQRLAHRVRDELALLAGSPDWELGVALSPGAGWELESGQRQLFALLDAGLVGVSLSPSSLMQPKKSTSFVVGIGPDMASAVSPCDLCDLGENCRFRRFYESEHGCDVLT